MRMPILASSLALGLTLSTAAQEAKSPPEAFQLKNGLTVLLRPVEGADDTAIVVLFDIGGDHDPSGRSGLAHLVEHLYVTAAAGESPARTVNELIRRYPNGWNAQTGDRYTVFATVFPKNEIDAELTEAAARMGDLRITNADLDREKPRVIEEVGNMFGGIPQLAAINNAREAIRPTPRGGRKGGLPEHVQAIRLDDVREHWRRYYKPSNATLVVAGGFDAASTRKRISERFGLLPAGEKDLAPGEPGEAKRGSLVEVSARSVVPNARSTTALAFVPPSPSDDLYAAYLVLLTRLYADSGGTGDDGPFVFAPVLDDPAVVAIAAGVEDGETADRAISRLEAIVSKAIEPNLRSDEAGGVRKGIGLLLGIGELPDFVVAQNPYGLAFSLGRRHQLGFDANATDRSLSQVDGAKLRRAAKEIFGPDRRAAAFVAIKAGAE